MKFPSRSSKIICTTFLSILVFCGFALAQVTEKVLWRYTNYSNGDAPDGNLVFDNAGNLYGTTSNGGQYNGGVVFKLSHSPDGGWTQSVIYAFCSQGGDVCSDGASPQAGLTIDAKGNLYGTTLAGGIACQESYLANSCGTVFQMTPPSSPGGSWTHTVLYRFCTRTNGGNCADGAYPAGGALIFDDAGNLYGEATAGGFGHNNANAGVVFELSPGSSGWKEKVLYNFCSLGTGMLCPDGSSPWGGLTFDSTGNLYGTATLGGSTTQVGGGVVFKLTPTDANWYETVLQAFPASAQGPDSPSGVIIGPDGYLYGTIANNGPYHSGGLFRLPITGGKAGFLWFDDQNGGPSGSESKLLLDTKRQVLYGTSPYGGASLFWDGGCVFQIAAGGKLTVLYSFCSQAGCADGMQPEGSVIMDKSGNLYGTTYFTTVYELEMMP